MYTVRDFLYLYIIISNGMSTENGKIGGVPVLRVIRVQEYATFDMAWNEAFNTRNQINSIQAETRETVYKKHPEKKRHFVSEDQEYFYTYKTDDGFNVLHKAGTMTTEGSMFCRWWLDINLHGFGHLVQLNEYCPRKLCPIYFEKNHNNLFSKWNIQLQG